MTISALVGLGLGVLIRHSVATMITGVLVLVMLPAFLLPTKRWSADLDHAMVVSAWEWLTADRVPVSHPGFNVATITGSWIVCAAWPLAVLVPALVVVRRRDV